MLSLHAQPKPRPRGLLPGHEPEDVLWHGMPRLRLVVVVAGCGLLWVVGCGLLLLLRVVGCCRLWVVGCGLLLWVVVVVGLRSFLLLPPPPRFPPFLLPSPLITFDRHALWQSGIELEYTSSGYVGPFALRDRFAYMQQMDSSPCCRRCG